MKSIYGGTISSSNIGFKSVKRISHANEVFVLNYILPIHSFRSNSFVFLNGITCAVTNRLSKHGSKVQCRKNLQPNIKLIDS